MKISYPSLFKSTGFNDIDKADIYKMFAEPFPHSKRRIMLTTKLREYIEQVNSLANRAGVNIEIWIDGSFTTEKLEPDDIDLVISAKTCELESLPIELKDAFITLVDNNHTKVNYNCDVYFCSEDDVVNRSYWRGWFLFDRDEKPKGIARIFL
ncbi:MULTISPECIES: DUF6932 family protein [Pseudoalteromonas]|jgi:hypothetical protein|uniref:DUF6932 family protein n=1 Tax=Pseudoalteromonas TaxID=53246 RepID=UPI00118FFB77|nr:MULTISPECIES: hypothetical protein [Pseudoalteromonas]MBB1350357.1 hypothetical protein [Pseudoalteromonas sp. SG45-3]MBB1357464.1 hypothetical protein [Pseudoalteromonas sp. SG45-6]TVU68213.1 hypothetical protein FQP81_20560 [Pseudoalteromonas elyakovii]